MLPEAACAPSESRPVGIISISDIVMSTPSACCVSLRCWVVSRIFASCSRASRASRGSRSSQAETRLPDLPCSSSWRTLTGACTRKSSPSGSTRRRIMYSRMAPVTTVSTTSFTVQSSARRTAFTSASGTIHQSKTRWGLILPLIGVSEAGRFCAISVSRSARPRTVSSSRRFSVSRRK